MHKKRSHPISSRVDSAQEADGSIQFKSPLLHNSRHRNHYDSRFGIHRRSWCSCIIGNETSATMETE